jgi:hypothetical protein
MRKRADLSGRSAKSEAIGAKADVAQLAERVLGKDEVTSSILVIGSSLRSAEVWSVWKPDEGELRLGKPARFERLVVARFGGLVSPKPQAKADAVITSRASEQRIWRKRNLIGPSRT